MFQGHEIDILAPENPHPYQRRILERIRDILTKKGFSVKMSEFGTLKSRFRRKGQDLRYTSLITFCAVPGFDFMVHLNLTSHTKSFYANPSNIIPEILEHFNAK